MEVQFIDKHLEDFVRSLDKLAHNRVLRMLDVLEKAGYQIRMPHAKKVSRDLFELRIQGAEQIRIFFTYHQNRILLLHGFIKKSQQIPSHELHFAEQKRDTLQ